MNKSELKKLLMPIIKECIREAILEEGVLSGVITEVAQGLSNVVGSSPQAQPQPNQIPNTTTQQPSGAVLEAKKQLSEVKASLQKATGMHGIFEGTTPMPATGGGSTSKYGALRDKDPADAGVNIDGLMKMTGGWSHLT